jgi:creatinine amidohydrolase/Fe(II)-dependent formamide hydrolase-like protein
MTSAVLVLSLFLAIGQSQAAAQTPEPQRSAGGGQCRNNPLNCAEAPNPLPAPDTVWIEEMTWMDVRDAMKAGKTTMIVATGGIEPNGPWLALGKHQYVLRANCDAIARSLGNALCAPLVPFVPEGTIEPPSSHMTTVGTISLRQDTFQALLTDIVHSMKVHGFENIVLIGDSGGNQKGMAAVAQKLNADWAGKPRVVHVPEYYDYAAVDALLVKLGVTTKEQAGDGLHDDPGITMNMMVADPESVRWTARVKAGKATINGVSIADRNKALEIGRQIVAMRTATTVAAIRKALAR